ncbi:hypothetical protein ACLK1T_22420 [Escherichia coli]
MLFIGRLIDRGQNVRVGKIGDNNPLHQQTSNRVPRCAGNTRRLNWRMV